MKQLNKISFILLTVACSLVVLLACKRTIKNDEILGSVNLKSAPSDFTGIINNNGAVNTKLWSHAILPPPNQGGFIDESFNLKFGNTTLHNVYFDNEFSHIVTWFIKFTGKESGAYKVFSSTSKTLDTNMVFWNGTAEGLRFFVAGEKVEFKLSFLGSSIAYSGLLSIDGGVQGPVKYDGRIKLLANGDTLRYKEIDDMDKVTGPTYGIRTSYSDQADGVGKASFYTIDNKQVQGFFAFYMKGTDFNGNGYCGGSSGESLTELQNFTTVKDPSKIFFNAYIYGYGRPNSSIFLQAFENDFANPETFSYPAPRDKSKNDMWYSIVEVDWVGWKLVSIPYSSFKTASNPLSGGGGNRIREPHKLCGFGIELESYPTPGLTVELAIDQVYLTENAPFEQ